MQYRVADLYGVGFDSVEAHSTPTEEEQNSLPSDMPTPDNYEPPQKVTILKAVLVLLVIFFVLGALG